MRTQRKGLEDVAAAADTTVEHHRHRPGRASDLGKHPRWRYGSFKLPAAMVRHDNAVGTRLARAVGVFGRKDALDHQISAPTPADELQMLPGEPVTRTCHVPQATRWDRRSPIGIPIFKAPQAVVDDRPEHRADGKRRGPPARGRLNSITFIDRQTGWAVSHDGKIIGTPDGGKSWRILARAVPAPLWSVTFTDAERGWAAGDNGMLLHTKNGGMTWTDQSAALELPAVLNRSDIKFTVVRFVDPSNGWASGLNGVTVHTADGGETWKLQRFEADATASIYAMSFVSPRVGFVAGNAGHVVATTDGGTTWFVVRGMLRDIMEIVLPRIEDDFTEQPQGTKPEQEEEEGHAPER